ncbi:acetate--CoA ligase family protein [Blastococcus sp. BMG 814]|uniref:Acetate--CoA ligase family protein n=1 Tax=Blastococcus carthaginiensis TaxID=3050034 RepID=A0ABT9IEC0_9ACTN|nr:acetate--CoA ligase family protein [Blastococcus carthaginiensis]MDP5183903.1 acetate--CoA ligase family protein [Blastococcus carthaginiensis]
MAVIGASSDPTKIGGRPIHHLRDAGFTGAIYPINPHRDEVQGIPALRSLDDVPGEIDLAIVAVPTGAVLDAVTACAGKGVKVAILFSAGFAEMGPDGAALQEQLVQVAGAAGMRLLGPNCIGAASGEIGAIATFAFAVQLPKPEGPLPRVALVSQSGAIGGHSVAAALPRGFQFDPWVTTGNEADIDVADCVAYLAMDDSVSAIAVYMEGCRSGERLKAALDIAFQRRKPVIMLKAGESDVGAAAAASHTASLVGSNQAYDALFHRYNVCRVGSITELVQMSYALAVGRLPAGRRLGILTGSGGGGILAADAASVSGLEVPPLPAAAQERLKAIWSAASVVNPIDTTAQVTNDPALLSSFLDVVLSEGDFDVVLLFLTYIGMRRPWSDNVVESLRKVRAAHPDATVMVSMLGTDDVLRDVRALGMPLFEELGDAVTVTARLGRLAENFTVRPEPEGWSGRTVRRLGPGEARTESSAKRLLSDIGIPVAREVLVTSAEDAARAAEEIGGAVAMKVESPDVLHKSEAGGVVLDVASPDEAAAAYDRITGAVRSAVPDADIHGVLVAEMVTGGVETILGIQNDASLGATVVFGLGGIFVEVLGDVSCRLAPIGVEEAEAMIREVKGFDLLDGARGRPRCDVPALADALSKLSFFAADNPDVLDSIDINPFIVLPEGQGAVAVDALVARRAAAH